MDHETLEALLPWYANGTLDQAGRRQVEGHLPRCASCRDLLEQARLFREESVADPGCIHAEHPQARLLTELVSAPGLLSVEVRSRLEAHLGGCDACRDAAQAYSTLTGSDPTEAPVRDEDGSGIWETLKRTIFGPLPALAYLLALLLVGWPALRSWVASEGPRQPAQVPTVLPGPIAIDGELLYRDPSAGAEPPAPQVIEALPAGATLVRLALQTDVDPEDLDDPALRYELRVASGGVTIWTRTVGAESFTRLGVLSLLLPADLLRDDGDELRLEVIYRSAENPLDGQTLFRRRVRVGS
jgi:anti-sigma factor RsiW